VALPIGVKVMTTEVTLGGRVVASQVPKSALHLRRSQSLTGGTTSRGTATTKPTREPTTLLAELAVTYAIPPTVWLPGGMSCGSDRVGPGTTDGGFTAHENDYFVNAAADKWSVGVSRNRRYRVWHSAPKLLANRVNIIEPLAQVIVPSKTQHNGIM
jgi:hypothetical protein